MAVTELADGSPQPAARLARPVAGQVVAAAPVRAHVVQAPAAAVADPPAAEPVTVTEDLAGDTSLREANPTTNYGTATTLPVGTGASAATRYRSLVHVPASFAKVPAGATITAATLTLYVESESTSTDRTVAVHRSLVEFYPSEDGSGNQSTWNNQLAPTTEWLGSTAGGTAGTDYAETPTDTAAVTATGTTVEFDVTADVAAMFAGTVPFYGWWIISQAEATTNSLKQFSSLNSATAGQRPVLSITYTP